MADVERSRWRRFLSPLLIALGCVMVVPATVAVWADSTVTDTDRYVSTVAPLVEDPAVQDAVVVRVTDEVVTAIDVDSLMGDIADGLAERGLGARATSAVRGLSGPVADGFESWVQDHVATVVGSDAFREMWTRANRGAHDRLLRLLTEEDTGDALTAEGDTVTVELGEVVSRVADRLSARGLDIADRIPEVESRIVIFRGEGLAQAQRAVSLVDGLGWWLTGVAFVLLAAGVWAASSRRRALLGAGLGVAASMAVLGVSLTFVRSRYVDALPPDVDAEAVTAVFGQLAGYLRIGVRVVLALGLVVALGAYLAGPSHPAIAAWLRGHKRPVQVAVLISAVIAIVLWDYPSGAVIAWILVFAAVVVLLVEGVAASKERRVG